MANRSRVDKIVSDYAKRNSLPADQLPALIASIQAALAGTKVNRQIEPAAKLVPAVAIERPIQPKSRTRTNRKRRGSVGSQTREPPSAALDEVAATAPSTRLAPIADKPVSEELSPAPPPHSEPLHPDTPLGDQTGEPPSVALNEVAATAPSAPLAPIADKPVSEELSPAPPPHSEPLHPDTPLGDRTGEPPSVALNEVAATAPSAPLAPVADKPVSEELSPAPPPHSEPLHPDTPLGDRTGEPPSVALNEVAATAPSAPLAPVADKPVSEELSPAPPPHSEPLHPDTPLGDQTGEPPSVALNEVAATAPSAPLAPVADKPVSEELSPAPPPHSEPLHPDTPLGDQTGEPPSVALNEVAATAPSAPLAPVADKPVSEELSPAPPLEQIPMKPVILERAPRFAEGETVPPASQGADDVTRTTLYKSSAEPEPPSANLAPRPSGRWLDDVSSRAESKGYRRKRWSRVIVSTIAVLAIVLTSLVFYVSRQHDVPKEVRNTERPFNVTLETLGGLVTEVVVLAEKRSVPRGVTVAFLKGAETSNR